ncbi:DUF4232 domain-containing protein [Streptomyces sp. NPDC007088]|uniref:DUF4232 domain-containing protein n=1 Tax=Streptomyces sp. NPDC007088 TaxID=3364773 RepID=UPI0036A1229B
MRAKKLTLVALALTAGLSLTACNGGEDAASSPHDKGSASSSAGDAGSSAGDSSSSGSSDSASSSSSSSSGSSDSQGGTSGSSSSSGTSGGGAAAGTASGTGTGTGTGTGGSGSGTGADKGSGGGQITTGLCETADLGFSVSHGMGEGDLLVSLKNNGGDACTLKGFPGVDFLSQDASGPLSAKRSGLAAPAVAVRPGESTRFTVHYPPNNTGGTGVHVSAIKVTPPNETHAKSLPVSISFPVSAGAADHVVVDPVGTGKQ